jgi:hypothetical protein
MAGEMDGSEALGRGKTGVMDGSDTPPSGIKSSDGSLRVTPVFPKKTKCKPICMSGSSFMHIVTYKCIQKQYHVRKREIIRDLHLILETKALNITGSRLGVAYAYHSSTSSQDFKVASSF